MSFNAKIQFKSCGGYGKQIEFPLVTDSGESFDPRMTALVDVLRHPKKMLEHKLVEIPGGWSTHRFGFKMIISFEERTHSQDFCVVYGYTSPAEQVHDDIRIYLSRVVGLRTMAYRSAGTVIGKAMFKRYDILMPQTLDENRNYRLNLHPLLRRLTTRSAFSHLTVPEPRGMTNQSGRILGRSASVGLHDLDVAKYCDRLIDAVRDVKGEPSNHLASIYHGEEDLYEQVASKVEPVSFTDTRLFSALRKNTRWTADGYITHRELLEVVGSDAMISVDYNKERNKPSEYQTLLGERLFSDFIKELAVEASDRGMERMVGTWIRHGDDIVRDFQDDVTITNYAPWHSPSAVFPDDELDSHPDHVPVEVPVAPMSLCSYYGVKSFEVTIGMDLAGDIVGTVKIDRNETQTFVKPAWALPLTSGLTTTAEEADLVVDVLDRYIKQQFTALGSV